MSKKDYCITSKINEDNLASICDKLQIPKSSIIFQIKCDENDTFLQNHVLSVEEACYKIKSNLDEEGIEACQIIVPNCCINIVKSITEILFSQKYSIKVIGNNDNVLIPWKIDNNKDVEKDVSLFLDSLKSKSDLIYLTSPFLNKSKFVHGFTTRFGGISTHPKQRELNLCYSSNKHDTEKIVHENRRRLCNKIEVDAQKFFIAQAVHGNKVWVYGKEQPTYYDAIISNECGVTIAAPAADCNTVLLVDENNIACAAIHAGWKGILAGVIKSTIDAMRENYGTIPSQLQAAIGPSLSVCCCEFGVEDSKKFLTVDPNCVIYREGYPKPFIDLRMAAITQLTNEGVLPQNIDCKNSHLDICTKCDKQFRFFSYRRMGIGFGTHVGFIGVRY